MASSKTTRRSVMTGALGLAATLATGRAVRAQGANPFGPPELIEAAKKEGSLVF
jgi:hypothetical protein